MVSFEKFVINNFNFSSSQAFLSSNLWKLNGRFSLKSYGQQEIAGNVSNGPTRKGKIKWGASSRWSLSLYCLRRNTDHMTTGNTYTTLFRLLLLISDVNIYFKWVRYFKKNISIWSVYTNNIQNLSRTSTWKGEL